MKSSKELKIYEPKYGIVINGVPIDDLDSLSSDVLITIRAHNLKNFAVDILDLKLQDPGIFISM
jgi:hypothetical protein